MEKGREKKCKLCGAEQLELVFNGRMRHSGRQERFDSGHCVYSCAQCGVEQIEPFPKKPGSNYEDGTYWRENKSNKKSFDFIHAKALNEALLWFKKIGTNAFRGKVVLDFGCGTGAFLDLVKGVAAETIGIEADPSLNVLVASNGHTVFSSIQEAIEAGVNADVLCSFDVLEHLATPIFFMSELRRLLSPQAFIYIGVPNQADFIKKMVPEYLGHFYHVEHLWYFSDVSLAYVMNESGYIVLKTNFLHKYNFMNLIEWAKTGRPPGLPTSELIDEDIDGHLNGWLETRGVSSHILISGKVETI